MATCFTKGSNSLFEVQTEKRKYFATKNTKKRNKKSEHCSKFQVSKTLFSVFRLLGVSKLYYVYYECKNIGDYAPLFAVKLLTIPLFNFRFK